MIENATSLSLGVKNLLVSELYCTFAATTCIIVNVILNLDAFIQNIIKYW